MLHFWPLILSALLGIWILRTAIVVALAHQHNQAERTKEANWAEQQSNPCKPLVSILIPACNEEATITDCIQSCIQSNYGNKEIIVVNDGSNDATSDQAHIAQANHPKDRITVIDFACNQGKTAALNAGLLYANGEFIVTLDADTRLSDPSSLTRLLQPLIQNQDIAACTGNLKIANSDKTIPNIQSIEYTKIIQTFKRAQSHVNAIMILPGAVSAFRATELRSIGGFSTSTLAEDADATMSLLQRRNRLLFTSSASAITQGPNTVQELLKQRIRWRVGQLQCLWKHRKLCSQSLSTAFFFIDTASTNLISAAAPFVLAITGVYVIQKGLWQQPIATLAGFVVIDIAATVFAYTAARQKTPSIPNYLRHLLFFSLCNPFITWSAIGQLLRRQPLQWRRANQESVSHASDPFFKRPLKSSANSR